jgi:prepilin-type N-terminal cleavage/methylation domain-containing protein
MSLQAKRTRLLSRGVRRSDRRGGRRAFTLLEVLVALGVLSVGIFGLMAAFTSSAQLRSTSKQSEFIHRHAQAYLATLRQHATAQAVRDDIAASPAWEAPGIKTEGKNSHNVDLQVGVTVTASNVRILSEAECAAFFSGHTYDLDRDGTHDENTANSTITAYGTVIPVELTISWVDAVTPTATRSMTLRTIIYPAGSITQ